MVSRYTVSYSGFYSNPTITRMKVMNNTAASWVGRILLSAAVTLQICGNLIFASSASAQQPSSSSIVGRWRSLETTKGGIGQIWEFRPDGTFDFSMGAVVNMLWRIENNQLVLPPATTDGPEQKANLKWLGDNKVKLEGEGSVVEFVRIGDRSDPANPIVGEWIGSTEMGGRNLECRYLFYPRGELLLLIPFEIQHGSYTISRSTLHLERHGQKRESRFKLADNLLTISKPEDAQQSRYARY